MLSEKQLKTLSAILRDTGQVFLASTVIGPFLLDKDTFVIVFGVFIVIFCWFMSILATK